MSLLHDVHRTIQIAAGASLMYVGYTLYQNAPDVMIEMPGWIVAMWIGANLITG